VSGFVVDASVAIKWFVDEVDSARAAGLLSHPLSAPDLLAPECANILWKKVARAELSLDEAEMIALALEGAAAITLHSTRACLARAMRIACALGCPAYDCCYLALAQDLQRPLVAADRRLVNVVRAVRTAGFAKLIMPLAEIGAGRGIMPGVRPERRSAEHAPHDGQRRRRSFAQAVRLRTQAVAIAAMWRWSVPQQPPSTTRCGSLSFSARY
jgi:predicted nucleic acid-binding protein